MKLRTMIAWSIVAFAILFVSFFFLSPRHSDEPTGDLLTAPLWQRMAAPGELSTPHAFLENNCAACHTSVKGVEPQNCIVCHADNKNILQRQPTAFHASITGCAACHLEHQGRIPRTTKIDHVALAHIGLKQIEATQVGNDAGQDTLVAWLRQGNAKTSMSPPFVLPPSISPHLQREEIQLNCASCHQTKDRHMGLFGNDCAQCHSTEKWTIPEFIHPSSISQSCNQCHQAPPSHYMMHFKMISMSIAIQPNAQVSDCFLCHQTTAWNDIKGIGFYKHH